MIGLKTLGIILNVHKKTKIRKAENATIIIAACLGESLFQAPKIPIKDAMLVNANKGGLLISINPINLNANNRRRIIKTTIDSNPYFFLNITTPIFN
ncbi:hypothetical protein [Clostridium sp.]|uniref:hypothetical protein n=1 Tax=Clostridium sp. TaxID=1506 RepID=UPI002FC6753E